MGGGGNLALNGGPSSASAAANGAMNGPSIPPGSPNAFLMHRARHTVLSTVHSDIHVKLDKPRASALSVDATGSVVVLAGRRGLHFVDLEVPYALAATLHHQTKWDVAVAKFNPHVACKSLVATTSHTNTLVWNVAQSLETASYAVPTSQPPLAATLRGHTRPVSDIGWAPTEPTLLATCSSDAKTHLWDTRAPQRPVRTLHAVSSSAVQLAWHRVDATTLATSHEGEVRIWDTRASDKTPAILITAHMQRIVGMDWHPKRLDELLTCSDDKTVKLWNVAHPRVNQGTLSTPTEAPVMRARYAPFGDAIVTSSHHQDTAMRLWHLAYGAGSGDVAAGGTITLDQVHAFTGHSDVVKSFDWRERASSMGTQYQLVSWAQNQELCMWRLDPHQLRACGHDVQTETTVGTAGSPENGSSEVSFDQVIDSLELAPSRRGVPAISKYDATTLKNDFVPLTVPPAAVPLGASEYSLVQGGHEENNAVLRALLTFDDDLSKINGDGNASEDDDENDDETDGATARLEPLSVGGRSDKANSLFDAALSANSSTAALPCPRIFGACFSGPNVLVMFDSRVALGQSRHLAATPPVAPVAPGKSAKPVPATPVLKKMPRTYKQLLEMRDSRFSKKKNKKSPPSRILSGAVGGIGGGAMELSSEWSTVPLEFMDTAGGFGGQDDTGDHSVHGKPHRGANRNSGGFYNAAGIEGGGGADNEYAVHGASEYLQKYFSNMHEQLHGPIHHADPRTPIQMTASIQGLSLSPPRSSMAVSSGLIRGGFVGTPLNLNDPRTTGKRTTDPPAMPSLQLDLSLSVSLLDLSRLCGVSSLLTYGTQLNVASSSSVRDPESGASAKKLDAGTHDLYSWMLKATTSRRISGRIQSRRTRRNTNLSSPVLTSQKIHPLSRILKSLLADGTKSDHESRSSVSDVCAHNARIASFAGRSDLQQVWALLELTTASNVQIPPPHQVVLPPLQQLQQQKTPPPPSGAAAQGVEMLVTSHPWRAHPFGQNLVNKVLAMYEDSGDLPTLAAIVCALQPPRLQQDDATDKTAEEIDQTLKPVNEFSLLYHGTTISFNSGASTAPATPSTMATASVAPARAPTGSPFSRSRTSFNNLTQLLGGQQADATDVGPPAMRSARRSTSHNEVAKLSQQTAAAAERGESPHLVPIKAGAKDWPVAATTRGSSRQQHHASPAMGPAPPPSGWKGLDFDKMENPFKTWSSGSTAARADVSPRPLTNDTFRPPGTPLSLAASMPPRRHRGSSVVDSDDEASLTSRILLHVDKRHDDEERHMLSTDPHNERRYGAYKEAYAEVLYQYGALTLRGDVLKSTATDTASSTSGGDEEDDDDEDKGLQFGVLCRSCQTVLTDVYCSACRDFSIKCSVCQLVVRGQSMYCMTCGHGGHEQHMRAWFEEENACPTGCGCWCKQATAMAMPPASERSAAMEQLPMVPEGRSRSYSF